MRVVRPWCNDPVEREARQCRCWFIHRWLIANCETDGNARDAEACAGECCADRSRMQDQVPDVGAGIDAGCDGVRGLTEPAEARHEDCGRRRRVDRGDPHVR